MLPDITSCHGLKQFLNNFLYSTKKIQGLDILEMVKVTCEADPGLEVLEMIKVTCEADPGPASPEPEV